MRGRRIVLHIILYITYLFSVYIASAFMTWMGLNNDHQGHGSNMTNEREREDEGRLLNGTGEKHHLHANF